MDVDWQFTTRRCGLSPEYSVHSVAFFVVLAFLSFFIISSPCGTVWRLLCETTVRHLTCSKLKFKWYVFRQCDCRNIIRSPQSPLASIRRFIYSLKTANGNIFVWNQLWSIVTTAYRVVDLYFATIIAVLGFKTLKNPKSPNFSLIGLVTVIQYLLLFSLINCICIEYSIVSYKTMWQGKWCVRSGIFFM